MTTPVQPPFVVAIMGPTASGKTALAVALARRWGGELINADSRQAIAELAVGVCKPSASDLDGVTCHGLDWRHLGTEFSAADFSTLARGQIQQTWLRRRIPLVVGGTGLYVRALLGGFDFGGADYDRDRVGQGLPGEDLSSAVQELFEVDPGRLSRIDDHNPRRVARALELARRGAVAGASPTDWKVAKLALRVELGELKQRIILRSSSLLGEPLLEEVRGLLSAGYSAKVIEGAAIGYREALGLLERRLNRDQALAALIQRTWRYARQQMTWLRGEADLIWVDSSPDSEQLASSCWEQVQERFAKEDL